jgi:uncharacterized membrane protein
MDADAVLLPTAVTLAADVVVEAVVRLFFCMCVWVWYARTQTGKVNSTMALNISRTTQSTRWEQQRKRINPMR